MKRASTPQQIAPLEAENENQPVESVALAPENVPEPGPTTAPALVKLTEHSTDAYYVHHWGINE